MKFLIKILAWFLFSVIVTIIGATMTFFLKGVYPSTFHLFAFFVSGAFIWVGLPGLIFKEMFVIPGNI